MRLATVIVICIAAIFADFIAGIMRPEIGARHPGNRINALGAQIINPTPIIKPAAIQKRMRRQWGEEL